MTNSLRRKLCASGVSRISARLFPGETAAVLLAFLLGALAGSLFGMFAPSEGLPAAVSGVLEAVGKKTYAQALIGCAGLHLLVLFFSVSLLGLLCIPALSAVRGFTLSCASAAIISVYRLRGAVLSLAVLGVPALLTLPCFFLLAMDGMRFSRRLLRAFSGAASGYERGALPRHLLISAALLPAAAAVEVLLVPSLLNGLL